MSDFDKLPSFPADLSKRLQGAVFHLAHGHYVVSAVEKAVTLERLIDLTIARALGRDEEWAVFLLADKLCGPTGLDTKLKVLTEVLEREGSEDVDALTRKVRAVVDLRNLYVHSTALLEVDGGEPNLISYRRGRSTPGTFDPEEADRVLSDADDAIEVLARRSS